MADRIVVSTEEMQQAVSGYEAARDTMQQAFNALTSAREALDACWEGPAKGRYVRRWEEINGKLRQSDQVLERAMEGLRNTIQINETAEDDAAGRANNLDVGTTPPNTF